MARKLSEEFVSKVFINDSRVLRREYKKKTGEKLRYYYILESGEEVVRERGMKVQMQCEDCGIRVERVFVPELIYRKYFCVSCSKKGEKNPFYGKTHTEETRKKLSLRLTGLLVGEKNPFYGKTHTEESRKKMSDSNKKYFESLTDEEKEIHSKKVSDGVKRWQKENPEKCILLRRKAGHASHLAQFENWEKNKLEVEFENILLEFTQDVEFSFVKWGFQWDFIDTRKKFLFEVQGDYWHGNPNLFGEEEGKRKLSEMQLNKIRTDKIKRKKVAQSEEYTLFEFWEEDIRNNKEKVRQRLKDAYKL